jgi:hypothetical protein
MVLLNKTALIAYGSSPAVKELLKLKTLSVLSGFVFPIPMFPLVGD